MRYVVTAGGSYLDIDAYGGMVAYAELLHLDGSEAIAVSEAVLNMSISPSLRQQKVAFETSYNPRQDDVYVMIDISDPKFFAPYVDENSVVEIIDHHLGFEQYWKEKGVNAQIEFIGAACTLVYERWKQSGYVDDMSPATVSLLAAGILDNTLNFIAEVTSSRDHAAYDDLRQIGRLGDSFATDYFKECQGTIERDLANAIMSDTKSVSYPSRSRANQLSVGQIATWDAGQLLKPESGLQEIMVQKHIDYCNLIDIYEGRSYFVTSNPGVQDWLSSLLGVTFSGDIATANRTWLRKEIMKQAIEQYGYV